MTTASALLKRADHRGLAAELGVRRAPACDATARIGCGVRRGFTLVELLVVIAIIGILVALLLPAIQAAREAARRSQCQNNLKQIGLALQNIHDTEGALPQGVYTDPRNDKSAGLSWLTRVLPYIEEQNKYDLIAAHVPPGFKGSAWDFYQPFAYAASLGSVIPTSDLPIAPFTCPSSDLPANVPEGVDKAVARGLATTSYKGSKGAGRRGVLLRPDVNDVGRIRKIRLSDGGGSSVLEIEQSGLSRYRFKDVTDGLSNTIAAGEASYAIEWNASKKQRWPIWIGTPGDDWDEVVLYKTEFTVNCEFGSPKAFWEYADPAVQAARKKLTAYNDDRNASDVNDCTFGWHPGGAMAVFVDGSVHFLAEDLEHRAHIYLGDPSDGQIVQAGDY
ncbi:MAG: DUF1559 domain-containing protein [Planctomycetales bacterium]|nr:DUF1559 domain-containing protein [Planctomycetales bacterium]